MKKVLFFVFLISMVFSGLVKADSLFSLTFFLPEAGE